MLTLDYSKRLSSSMESTTCMNPNIDLMMSDPDSLHAHSLDVNLHCTGEGPATHLRLQTPEQLTAQEMPQWCACQCS